MSEQNIHTNFSRLTREEKKDFLAKAMSDLGAESLTDVMLLLPLRDIPSALKARIIFRLGITAVGHSYWLQSSGVQVWEFPQVPPALRPLITAVSRLVGEFEAAIASAVNGRGDYAKVVVLLNPERIEQLGQEIRGTVLGYAAELRTASGRNRRPTRQKAQGEERDTEPVEQAAAAQAEGENGPAVQDMAEATGKGEGDSQALPEPDSGAPEGTDTVSSGDAEEKTEDTDSTAKTKRKRAGAKAEVATPEEAPVVVEASDVAEDGQVPTDTNDGGSFSGLFNSFLKPDES